MELFKLKMIPGMNDFQRRVIGKRAHRHFDKLEDREEFVQNTLEFMWQRHVEKGERTYEGRPDLYDVNMAVRSGIQKTKRKGLFGYDSNGARPVAFLKSDGEKIFYQIPERDWDDLTLFCVPKNEKDAAVFLKRKLVSKCGFTIMFDDREACEFWGYTQSSIGRCRKLGRELKIYLWKDDNIYPSLKAIQKKFDITEAKARWHIKKIFKLKYEDKG